jgi:hypothetical protein
MEAKEGKRSPGRRNSIGEDSESRGALWWTRGGWIRDCELGVEGVELEA